MSVKEIEAAIVRLPVRDVNELMTWLAEHHAQVWDKQIEDDLDSGKLDGLLTEVDQEYDAGIRPVATPLEHLLAGVTEDNLHQEWQRALVLAGKSGSHPCPVSLSAAMPCG